MSRSDGQRWRCSRQPSSVTLMPSWSIMAGSGAAKMVVITGLRKTRLQTLLKHDINLIAYHLPLDGHPAVGQQCTTWPADSAGFRTLALANRKSAGWGTLEHATTVAEVVRRVAGELQRTPLLIGDPERPVSRVGWCSGGAQGLFEQAIALGVDLYLSGEISEQTVHLARESGVAYLAAGHHASERYGALALAGHLAERFGLDCQFVDLDNPV
jgi:putative NIF3 family GTP cyclohydrolase 1 type 2